MRVGEIGVGSNSQLARAKITPDPYFHSGPLTSVPPIPHNRIFVTQRLNALALALVLLATAVAPAAAECLPGSGAPAEMGCCKRKAPCGNAVLQAACCPCSPQVSSTEPGRAAVAPQPSPVLQAQHVDAPPVYPGRVSLDTQAAFAVALLRNSHDPPWLLNASLLI